MSVKDVENKNRIRRKMIEQCSSSIIVFGYGDENSGTYQEYNIAKEEEKNVIPMEKTGFAAKEIYNEKLVSDPCAQQRALHRAGGNFWVTRIMKHRQ
mgnify:CR=1 FL=1